MVQSTAAVVPAAALSLTVVVGAALAVMATLVVGVALGFWLRGFGEPKLLKKVTFGAEGGARKLKKSDPKKEKTRDKAVNTSTTNPPPKPSPKSQQTPQKPQRAAAPTYPELVHEEFASDASSPLPAVPVLDLPPAPPAPPLAGEADTDQSEPAESPGPVSPVSMEREDRRPPRRAKERSRFVYHPSKPRLSAAVADEEPLRPEDSPPPKPVPPSTSTAAKRVRRRSPKPRRAKAMEGMQLVIGGGTTVPPARRIPQALEHVGAEAGQAMGSVVLQWLPPDSPNAPLEAYFVTISPTGSVMRVPVGDVREVEGLCEFTVRGLQPGRPVRFGLQAANMFGAAPVGSLSEAVTPKGPPYAIAALHAEARDGACFLRWQSPNDGGDPISEYIIDVKVPQTSSKLSSSPCISTSRRVYRPQLGGVDAASCSSAMLVPQTAEGDGAVDSSTAAHDHVWEVMGLANGQPYTFTVRASNRFGLGPESRNSNMCTPRGPPRGVANVAVTLASTGGSGCVVSWDPPPVPTGEKVEYIVLLTGKGVESTEVKSRDGNKVSIRTLRRGKYVLAVVASSIWGRSMPVEVPGTLHTDGKGGLWRWTVD